MAKSNRSKVANLVRSFEPVLRKAFLAAVDDITASADLKRIVTALEANDIDGALRAVHLDPAAFRPLDVALSQAYEGGGNSAASQLSLFDDPQGNRLVVRFDARNPRAEAWLSGYSSKLIKAIVDDQRASIRSALERGMAAGTNPRTVGLDIVGRVDKATGKRTGGIIGLTEAQEQYVQNFRAELQGEGAELRTALMRQRRDMRLDNRILSAINNGKSLDAETIRTLLTRYRASLLQMRGEAIGRTEAQTSVHKGQDEAYQQAIGAGKIDAKNVTKVWDSSGDSRVRETHRLLDGQRVKFDGYFISESGARLRYPGDPAAPASEIINCRCSVEYDVNFLADVK